MKTKTLSTIVAILLTVTIAGSMILLPPVKGNGSVYTLPGIEPGYVVPTYLYLNVAPNPIGVGQTVNVNAFFGASIIDRETPNGDVYNVTITSPNGNTETRKLIADSTGGGYINFVPSVVGEYKFQAFYGGQTMTIPGFINLVQGNASSSVVTLTVQEDPITQRAYPFTPLPTNWWENPVSAQNTQNWYKIMGPTEFRNQYNATSYGNPYTESVLSGHILWTYPWGGGGVVGGQYGGDETDGQYWTARQYEAQYSPITMNGKMWSNWWVDCTGYSNGILCIDLKTGETLYRINTTSTILCGMQTSYDTPNAYGSIGPYIWTTGSLPASETGGSYVYSKGTQFNLYSGTTGQYVMSIVNGTNLSALHEDEKGNLIGYFTNSTPGKMNFWNDKWYQLSVIPSTGLPGPSTPLINSTLTINSGESYLCQFNFTKVLWNGNGNNWEWTQKLNEVLDFNLGVQWAEKVPTTLDGKTITPGLSFSKYAGDAIILNTYMYPSFFWQSGWDVMCSMKGDVNVGQLGLVSGNPVNWIKNFTYPTVQALSPFTRWIQSGMYVDGKWIFFNLNNNHMDAVDLRDGSIAWSADIKTPYGDGTPNRYDEVAASVPSNLNINGQFIVAGFGGDIWNINATTGATIWYTNTTTLIGHPGIETPYDVWPIWSAFSANVLTSDVLYVSISHAYNPPMFHGAQIVAVNMTDGSLVWSELDFPVIAQSISYGVLTSLNGYDNQVYGFGKGPSAITVNVPSVGVTTETAITISGTVMDVSAGTKQSEVEKNYPYGLPCVSDASQSKFMEHVYQDQPMPSNATGVAVTLSVLDSNGNYRDIGTTTSDALGTYTMTWTPDISGDYKIYATFAGSNSYYGSSASSGFTAGEVATHAPTSSPASGLATTSDVWTGIAVIAVVIIIVGAALGILLRKRP